MASQPLNTVTVLDCDAYLTMEKMSAPTVTTFTRPSVHLPRLLGTDIK